MKLILKRIILAAIIVCMITAISACGKKKTNKAANTGKDAVQTQTDNNGNTQNGKSDSTEADNGNTNENTAEDKPIENTQVTEKEFEQLVADANSDDEEVKKAALEKLQVILDSVEQNSTQN